MNIRKRVGLITGIILLVGGISAAQEPTRLDRPLTTGSGEPITVATDPNRAGVVYVGTVGVGVYRSGDGGATWSRRWLGGTKPIGGTGSSRIWSEQEKESP